MTKRAKQISSEMKAILGRHQSDRSALIPILQDIQEKFGYLCEEALGHLEESIGISVNEIYGVATFYTQFRFTPPGEHNIQVCQGTACHVRGGQQILGEVEQRLGIKAGQTTKDGKFDLQRVACLGCCALAPVVTLDGKVHAEVTAKKIPSILAGHNGKKGKKN
ncbi:MAG: NADH-quinone oxidoreductase subunit NuoE [Planctomycetota bacterium]|jgi:NADH-quinone oxidoreductase subunit E